jgi:hypothetical protein
MLAAGLRYKFGSPEESLLVLAQERKAEIEYLKIRAIVNAIVSVGSSIRSALSGTASGGNDGIQDSMNSLKVMLLPHLAEDRDRRAAQIRKTLIEEANRGPIQIKIMDRKKRRR